MPSYVFVVMARKRRDGGWLRVFGHFRNQQYALEQAYWRLVVSAEFSGYKVVRTISFKKQKTRGWTNDIAVFHDSQLD